MGKEARAVDRRWILGLGALLVVGAAWAVASSMGSGDGGATAPGTAPPGKVWSAEHGHWHDAPGMATQPLGQPSSPSGQASTPPPPGDAPAGKVWSGEHGHWHDEGGGSEADSNTP